MTKQCPVDAGAYPLSDSFEVLDGDLTGRLIILVDHASNAIPPEYGDLGMPDSELARHIASDIGAGPLGCELAERLRAPAVLSCFSRLLIDPNRGEDDPTLVMRLSDGALVPGNGDVDAAERERRLRRFYRPYHAAVEAQIQRQLDAGITPILFSIHSFTPIWKGVPRPWHAGILWDRDPRLPHILLEGLRREHGLRVGDNEPYLGSLRHDTMYRHGTMRGLPHALLEVRSDLIDAPAGVQEWADRLEPLLQAAAAEPSLHAIRYFGSQSDELDPR